MQTEIIEFLRKVGFSPAQSLVYWEILSGAGNSVKELEIRSKFARSTVVEALLYLERRGLIFSRVEKTKKKLYAITSIHKLNSILDSHVMELKEEEDRLLESSSKIGKFIKILGKTKDGFDPSTQIYLGKKEIIKLYRSTITQDYIYSICKLDDYYQLFPGGLSLQSQANRLGRSRKFKDLIVKGEALKTLVKNQSTLSYKNYEFKEIKQLDVLEDSSFSDILICDTFTIFSNFKDEVPYSIKLNSIEISKFLKSFHNLIWNLL